MARPRKLALGYTLGILPAEDELFRRGPSRVEGGALKDSEQPWQCRHIAVGGVAAVLVRDSWHLVDEQLQALGRAVNVAVHEHAHAAKAHDGKARKREGLAATVEEHARSRGGDAKVGSARDARAKGHFAKLCPARCHPVLRPKDRSGDCLWQAFHDAWDIGLAGSAYLIGSRKCGHRGARSCAVPPKGLRAM
eukprot:scaffold34662_cov64-Phaeocystis_antarctica.AAC.4